MAAGKYNITIEKKATFRRDFTLYSTYIGAGNIGNVPVNLTGCTISAKIKRKLDDTAIIIAFSTSLIDAVHGKFRIELTAAQTAALAFDVGVYDVLVTTAGGITTKYIAGNVVLAKTAS